MGLTRGYSNLTIHLTKKIWIDLDNSPHVPFFKPIIHELSVRGYDVFLTARDAFQVAELIKHFNLSARLIGHHYGKNKLLKAIGLFYRVFQIAPSVLKEKPDLALAHGSRTQYLLASLLRIPAVQIFDYEHAQAMPIVRAGWIMIPEIINENISKYDNIIRYPGIKEDVYVPSFKPDGKIMAELGLSEGDLVITVRPPATEAHYHNPQSEELFIAVINFLGEKQNTRIVLLPRNDKQASFLKKRWPEWCANSKIIIPDHVVNGLNLIWYSDLVVSGGGTVNREASALGVPVYSIFRGKIGAVDRYLSETKRLVLISSVEDVRSKIVLAKRHRPHRPEHADGATLQYIVDHIISILRADR